MKETIIYIKGGYTIFGLDTIDGLLFSTRVLKKEDYPTDRHIDELWPGYRVVLRQENSIDELLNYIEKEYYIFKDGEREYLKEEMEKAEEEYRDIVITYPGAIAIYLSPEYGFEENYWIERLDDYSKVTGLSKEEILKRIEEGKKEGLSRIAIDTKNKFGVKDFDREEAIKNLNGEKFGLERLKEIHEMYKE